MKRILKPNQQPTNFEKGLIIAKIIVLLFQIAVIIWMAIYFLKK